MACNTSKPIVAPSTTRVVYAGICSWIFVGCRLLKVGGRAVLLVGAEFRQLLLGCVSELNGANDSDVPPTNCDISSDSARSCLAQSANATASVTDNSSATLADVNSSNVVNSVCSVLDGGHTTADDVASAEYVGETADDVRLTDSCPVWTTFLQHYVKLGETHAYICGFTKNR